MKYNLLGNNYSSDSLIKSILKNRGIQNVDKIICPTHEDDTNVNELPNIKQGIEMLQRNLTKHILLLVDSDVDGNTSAAIMLKYIKFINPLANVSYYIHSRKAHGITNEFLEYVKEKMPDMIIITDAGTNDVANREIISNQMGIDLLIIDHHAEGFYTEKGGILINNHSTCPKNNINKNLTGAGMTFLFCKALEQIYNTGRLNSLIDLAMMGLIGDSASLLDNEIRRMCFDGLDNINSNLVKTFYDEMSKNIDSLIFKDLSYGGIIPLINSIIRVGSLKDRQLVFKALADLDMNYSEIVTKRKLNKETRKYEMVEFNYNIYQLAIDAGVKCKNNQQKLLKPTLEEAEQQYNPNASIQIFVTSEENKNLTGLIANRLKSDWKAPTIVVWLNEEGTMYNGSLRGYEETLPNFKEWCKSTGLFTLVQGHDNAAGVQLPAINMMDLMALAEKNFEKIEKSYDIDLLYDGTVDTSHVFELNNYQYLFGNGLEEPLALVKNLKVAISDIQYSKKTLRLKCGNMTYIKFGVSEEEYDNLIKKINGHFATFEVVGTFKINEYYGRIFPQMAINDFELIEQTHESFGDVFGGNSENIDYGIFA